MNGLPSISHCDAVQCFYNRGKSCHAPAINVGDSAPCCDTYVANENQHINRQDVGAVGACHVADCRWNSDLVCSAPDISVNNQADCITFQKR